MTQLGFKERHPKWKSIVSIVEIASERKFKDKVESEKRYYLSSLPADAKKILAATRLHWGVESAPQAHKLEVDMN